MDFYKFSSIYTFKAHFYLSIGDQKFAKKGLMVLIDIANFK